MSQYPPEERGATSLGSVNDPNVPSEPVWSTVRTVPQDTFPSSSSASPSAESATTDVAKDQAAQVKDTAVDAGKQVADTAKDQAHNVAGEAKDQALSLLDQAKSEAGSQAGTQQQRIAGLLGGYASELQAMTSGQDSSGAITDLARQGADKAGELTSWLENHEPGDVLDEIRSFARRRPVAFLVGSALAGVVVGRATRGFAANARAEKMPSSPATPVRAELPGYSSTPSHAYVDPSSQAGDYGYDTAPTYGGTSTSDAATDGTSPVHGSEPANAPVFDPRDDVTR